MLLLHTFKAIYDKDNRYKLYIAGEFQDERYVLYFNQMIKELGLENNVFFEGWQNDLDKWLEDKNYILCSSLLESQNLSVMQAMAKGIKPIIHNFVGAKYIYPEYLLFNKIDDVLIMLNLDYNSNFYREYIKNNYSLIKQISLLKKVFNKLEYNKIEHKEKPLVSIVMTVYNKEKFLKDAIESVLIQTYSNIELIIINDGSTDNSEEIIMKFNDSRIRYYKIKNAGQLEALKFGIQQANGDYIARVDSDDKIDSKYVEICLFNIMKDNADFVYTDFLQ
ncbi:glycosyltransferase [Caloramator sp. Dgby_cultured_2]|uniref:glycosyltransferase n=1 Tax=Caloramator sp. Dgby_cultured_2 TaxID=3029174 RepID=UPI00237E02CC|nr:glycosyltransferase [Caloramator sp. Dgby_cultured_2]WDU83958.1 glycosyltransferase [Caloramator sp. Dgby_cultured_2]